MITEKTKNDLTNFIEIIVKAVNAAESGSGLELTAAEVASIPAIGKMGAALSGSGFLPGFAGLPYSQPIIVDEPEHIPFKMPKFEDTFKIVVGAIVEEIEQQINEIPDDGKNFWDAMGDLHQMPDGKFYFPITVRRRIEPASGEDDGKIVIDDDLVYLDPNDDPFED